MLWTDIADRGLFVCYGTDTADRGLFVCYGQILLIEHEESVLCDLTEFHIYIKAIL